MAEGDPKFGQVVRAIEIYSGLPREEIRRLILREKNHGIYENPSYVFAAMVVGRDLFDMPYDLVPHVLSADRKLTHDEVAAYRQREREAEWEKKHPQPREDLPVFDGIMQQYD